MLIAIFSHLLYNNMMTRTKILHSALLLSLLVPTVAMAYTSPEEILGSEENARFFDPPPSPREAESVQAAQQASVAARREQEQAALFPKKSSSSSSSSEETLHDAAPVMSGQQSSLSLEDQRILERVHAEQQDAEIDARVQMLIAQQGLHSGAPLTSSGPETTIAAFVLAGAGLWTIWKAKRLEARSR